MTERFSLIALVCLITAAAAIDKVEFDIAEGRVGKVAAQAGAPVDDARQYADQWIETTMLPGGYFTVGTVGGVDAGILDDGCGIAFGHPYAMTSYPVFSVDGEWYRFDQYFPDRARVAPQQQGNVLRVEAVEEGKFALAFSLTPEQGTSVGLRCSITNLDTRSHRYGLGLIFDPALGKWGDGHLRLEDGGFLKVDSLFAGSGVPTLMTLWEKSQGAPGMGLDLFFPPPRPERVAAANWGDLREGRETGTTGFLYDLALKADWGEKEMGAGEARTVELFLSLKEPDFGKGMFLRWDMPSFLILAENRLFPRDFKTYLEIANASGQRSNGVELSFSHSPVLLPAAEKGSFSINASRPTHREIDVRSKLVFEDRVVRVGVSLEKDGQQLDVLERVVFMPATPVSDTGLTVQVNSLDLDFFPEVGLVFEATEEASGLLIIDLEEENLFLYENGQRIDRFSVGKDTTGGAHAADVVFVFDVTGSMGDEITAVRNSIVEFADSLTYRRVDLRLGLITFLDEIESVYPFTRDAQEFRLLIQEQFPHGGGDRPENSLDGLMEAAQLSFRPGARRIVIWITDADYHENDAVTRRQKGEVIDALLENQVVVNAVGASAFKQSYYDPFTLATGGNYYDITGNFRDILLDISRLPESGRYMLTYLSPNREETVNRVELEIRYAGLGGMAAVEYSPPRSGKPAGRLVCFPNPFNAEISLLVDRSGYARGELNVYNALGQRIERIELDQTAGRVVWDAARDERVGTGLYLLELVLEDDDGRRLRETARIVFLK